MFDPMECPRLPEVLALHEDELDGAARASAEAHQAQCAACRAEHGELERLSALLRRDDPAPAPAHPRPEMRAALLARCASEAVGEVSSAVSPRPASRRWGPLQRAAALALVGACAAVATFLLWPLRLEQGPDMTAREDSGADRRRASVRVIPPSIPAATPPVHPKGDQRAETPPQPSPPTEPRQARRRRRPLIAGRPPSTPPAHRVVENTPTIPPALPQTASRPPRKPTPAPARPELPAAEPERLVIIMDSSQFKERRREVLTVSVTATGDPSAGGSVAIVESWKEETLP